MKYISTLYSNSSVDNANVTFGHRIEFTYNERKAVFLYWVCREYSTYLGRLAGTVSDWTRLAGYISREYNIMVLNL